jgi:light-regulated signal transduction histidine kinase (bacteriophytochrome)
MASSPVLECRDNPNVQLLAARLQTSRMDLGKRTIRARSLTAERSTGLAEGGMTSEQTDSRSKSEREEIGQFLASISHDLKQPLRTICSYSDLLWQRLETSRDNDVNRFLTNVRDAANRMQTLLDDALEFALAEASGRERDWVDMGSVVRFALSNLEAAIAQTGAAVTCDRLPPVHGNFGALARVFQNLIGNALKYRSQQTPRIHVGCASSSDGWIFSVADNGIGIRSEYVERVFEPFMRLHTQSQHPGTGLGLAICRQIVASHDGCIWLDSTPGAGSTFYFTLPGDAESHQV